MDRASLGVVLAVAAGTAGQPLPAHHTAMKGVLSGYTLNITLVHSPGAVEMGYDAADPDAELLPWNEWSGFLIDLLDRIKEEAGFEYNLYSPSGHGAACNPPGSGVSAESASGEGAVESDRTGGMGLRRYATQLSCGANDLELGLTDVLWAFQYVTPSAMSGSLSSALITAPFLSDKGLVLLMPKFSGYQQTENDGFDLASIFQLRTVYEKIQRSLILAPFTPSLWFATVITVLLVSFTMWYLEHAGKHAVATKTPNLGFCVKKAVGDMPQYNYKSVYQLMRAPVHHQPVTWMARTLNMAFCVFCTLWGSAYVAKLTTYLTAQEMTTLATNIDELVVKQHQDIVGSACVHTSHADWLSGSYPGLKMVQFDSQASFYDALQNGTCDAIIDGAHMGDYLTHTPAFCAEDLRVVAPPLKSGPQDLSAAVRSDLPEVERALSYWITVLRTCSMADTRDRSCQFKSNIEKMYKRSFKSNRCFIVAENAGLSASNFAMALSALWMMCFLLILIEFCGKRMRDRIRARTWSSQVLDHVRDRHPNCWDGNQLDMDALVASFVQDDEVHSDMIKALRRHYIKTDVAAWQKLITTQKHLRSERHYAEHKISSQQADVESSKAKSQKSDGTWMEQPVASAKRSVRWSSLLSPLDLLDDEEARQELHRKLGSSGEVIKSLFKEQEVLLRRAIKENIDEQHGRNVKSLVHIKAKQVKQEKQHPDRSSRRDRSHRDDGPGQQKCKGCSDRAFKTELQDGASKFRKRNAQTSVSGQMHAAGNEFQLRPADRPRAVTIADPGAPSRLAVGAGALHEPSQPGSSASRLPSFDPVCEEAPSQTRTEGAKGSGSSNPPPSPGRDRVQSTIF